MCALHARRYYRQIISLVAVIRKLYRLWAKRWRFSFSSVWLYSSYLFAMLCVTWTCRIKSWLVPSTRLIVYRRPIRPSSPCRTSLTSVSFALLLIKQNSVKCESLYCTPTTQIQISLHRLPSACVWVVRSGSPAQTLTPSRKTRTWPRTWRERIAKTVWTIARSHAPRFAGVSTIQGWEEEGVWSGVFCHYSSTDMPSLFSPVDDPCDAAPCANGGNCSRTGLTDFSCACDGSWSGPTCIGESVHVWYCLCL